MSHAAMRRGYHFHALIKQRTTAWLSDDQGATSDRYRHDLTTCSRVRYQDVRNAPVHMVAEIIDGELERRHDLPNRTLQQRLRSGRNSGRLSSAVGAGRGPRKRASALRTADRSDPALSNSVSIE